MDRLLRCAAFAAVLSSLAACGGGGSTTTTTETPPSGGAKTIASALLRNCLNRWRGMTLGGRRGSSARCRLAPSAYMANKEAVPR
jgi:hypothetical protein